MSGLTRDHTITPSWMALDTQGRRVVCVAGLGSPLPDISRPWRRLGVGLVGTEDSDRIILPSSSAERPLEMVRADHVRSLREFLSAQKPMDLVEKIAIACAMTRQLATVHACNVLHASVSLDSMLIDTTDHTVKIVDFLAAMQLAPGECLGPSSRSRISEVLAMTPEGAGHADRPIDHRTDLYALGAALYHLFAGRPIFALTNKVTLLHAHVAKIAEPLSAIVDVPPILSEVVAALLKKQADERYQRAANLLVDLETILEDLKTTGKVRFLALRLRDRNIALADGDVLYGRDNDIKRMRDALGEIFHGCAQRMLVTGPPGVGKSALGRRFAGEVSSLGCRTALGKFEQYETDVPYLGIVRCFEALIEVLLGEREGALRTLASELALKLNENLAVLGSILANLSELVGELNSQEPLGGFGARDRLAQCFLGFLDTVASRERPVVLFLDDLQWADSASLDLLHRISEGLSGSVLLIGMNRAERNTPGALADAILSLSASGTEPLRLDLIALTRSDVEDLLIGAFGQRPNQIEAAALVYAKTLGNPLFVSRFLSGLDDGAVLDSTGGWNIANIAAVDGADDVVDFLFARLVSLDPLSRQILGIAACFGMSFDRTRLQEVVSVEDTALCERLLKLVIDGFLVPVGELYLFAHDRIREAAYRLAEQRHSIHRTIGRQLLLAGTANGSRSDAYAIVRHLKTAGDISDDPFLQNGYQLAVQQAAMRAHAAAAFDIARDYALMALDSAGDERWSSAYDTMAATLIVKADSTVSLQDHERFDQEYPADVIRLQNNEHRLRLALVRVMSLHARALCEEALVVGLGALRLIGIDLPEGREQQREALTVEFGRFHKFMEVRSPNELSDLPVLDDPCTAIGMQILFRLAPNAHNTMKSELFALMAVHNANLMFQHGRDALASGIAMTLAITLAASGEGQLANRFAVTAMEFDTKEGRRPPASVSFVYTYFFSHWVHPLEASLPSNLDGMRTGYELGDIQFGSFHAAAYVIHLASLGAPLRDVVRVGREHASLIAARIHVASFHCQLEVAVAEALQGMTAAPTCLLKEHVENVDEVLRRAGELDYSDRGFFLARHLQLAYIFGDFPASLAFAEAVLPILPGIAGNFVEAEIIVFSLLADLATDNHRLARFDWALTRLSQWSDLNPSNFACRYHLVCAGVAHRHGRAFEAIDLYTKAISEAKRQRFIHVAALSCEHAGRFYLEMGDDVAGFAHLREALALYEEWGAQAKVSALLDEFSNRLVQMSMPQTNVRQGELAVVLSAARAISAEINLDQLLQKIMTSVQEISGATYGALILGKEAGFFTEVVSRHGEGVIICEAQADPLERSQRVPRSIIASVERSQTILVLKNAASSEFARDPYIRASPVVSVLCAPLTVGGKLDGFIYLENNLTVGAFNPQSAHAIEVLAAQAAIALTNARLFALLNHARTDLANANEDLERKIEACTEELARARNLALAKAAEADRASQAEKSANEAKSRFLSVVSHEIRTPMNGLLGMLQLLDRERLGAGGRRQVDLAQQSGFALVKLIDGILDYSRLELGSEEATHENFTLSDLLETSVELFRPSAEAKGITLDVAINAPAGLVLRSDAQGISRVIMNLVGNAVKFTSEGRIWVTLEFWDHPGPTDALAVIVRDTGIGIRQDMRDRIFEDFVQADTSVERRHDGTGLGLSICRRIVTLLGGTIQVFSAPGGGSIFKAEIPVSQGTEVPPKNLPKMGTAPLSLLVVDDDEINRDVAAGLLQRLGHTVACAESCDAAIMALARSTFDALILDLHMPDVDGIETARRLQLSTRFGPCPTFIMLTADVTERSRRRCLEQGIHHILPKPLRLEALIDLLSSLPERVMEAAQPSRLNGPIDERLFAERCAMLGLPQMVRLIRKYHRTSRETMEAIREAALASDAQQIVRLAHRLRSAAGSLQFDEMEAVASRLELTAASGGEDLDETISTLRDAFRRSVAAALKEIRTLRSQMPAKAHDQPRLSTSGPSL